MNKHHMLVMKKCLFHHNHSFHIAATMQEISKLMATFVLIMVFDNDF
jgi:hypothetical protein